MDKFAIAARIKLFNNVIAEAQAAITILQDKDSDEDELSIDTFLCAKAVVKEIATVYCMQSIQEELADE